MKRLSNSLDPLVLWSVGVLAGALFAQADTLELAWQVAPGDRAYVTTGNTERGVALNPVTSNVLLLGRAGSPEVYVLKATDGSDGTEELGEPRKLSKLDIDGNGIVSGGTFALNLVGVAEDGAVYACNLTTAPNTTPFKFYRWANDSTDTPVSLAYEGDPSADENGATGGSGQDIRFGDNFAVWGSGVDTRAAVTSRNGKWVVLFTTTDGLNFTAKRYATDATVTGMIGLGLTFGASDVVFAKLNSQVSMFRLKLDDATGAAVLLGTTPLASGVTGLGYDPVTKRLGVVDYSAHTMTLYDLTDPVAPVQIGDALPMPAKNTNGNGTTAVDVVGNLVVGLDTNSGLLLGRIVGTGPEPPSITTQPAGVTAYAGAAVSFSVMAKGTAPLSYQWSFQGAPIPGQTAASLTLTGIALDQTGNYTVTVSNSVGSETSSAATLTVQAPVQSVLLESLWSLGVGSRPYLAEDNAQRGLAYNKATGNLLLVSRTTGNQVIVLDGATGAYKHELSMLLEDGSPIGGGTFGVNMIGVTDDGVVYVGNLTTDGSASPFRLYRWEKDTPEAIPSLIAGFAGLGDTIPDGTIGYRWGDSLDVRGTSPDEQIALGTRDHKKFAILFGLAPGTGSAMVFELADANAGNFGLGIAFGQGNTVWATATGQPLIQASFNLDDGSAALLHTYGAGLVPTAAGPVGIHPTSDLLFAIAFEIPDNVQAYDISDLEGGPVLVDQEMIFADRLNANGTGAIDAQGDKVFVLDTNNGVFAYKLNSLPPSLDVARISGSNFVITLKGAKGVTYQIQSSATLSGGDWTTLFERQGAGTAIEIEVPMVGAPVKFIRARTL